MGTKANLVGKKFGKLVVERETGERRANAVVWECRCECGTLHEATTGLLNQGKVKSCGCLHAESMKVGVAVRHGASRKGKWTIEYACWSAMKSRCFSKSHVSYEGYGGRGITVCERWLKFDNFLADMGFKPTPDHQIERINNNGNYEPGNCIWVTRKANCRNRRDTVFMTVNGVTKSLQEWAEFLGVKSQTLWARRDRGMSDAEAITTPFRRSPVSQDTVH